MAPERRRFADGRDRVCRGHKAPHRGGVSAAAGQRPGLPRGARCSVLGGRGGDATARAGRGCRSPVGRRGLRPVSPLALGLPHPSSLARRARPGRHRHRLRHRLRHRHRGSWFAARLLLPRDAAFEPQTLPGPAAVPQEPGAAPWDLCSRLLHTQMHVVSRTPFSLRASSCPRM